MRILDTDVCIALLRGLGHVVDRAEQEADSLATTSVTAAELYYGAAKSREPARNRVLVTDLLSTLPVLEPGLVAAQQFGSLKASLDRSGERLADADLFIASIALAEGALLVTGNRRHFDRIPGLHIEDWIRD